jgi:class 3 adenylate cyclase
MSDGNTVDNADGPIITAIMDEAQQSTVAASHTRLAPFASKFTSDILERQFLLFLQPARSLTLILFLITTLVSIYNLAEGLPTLNSRRIPLIVQTYRIFVTAAVTLCFLCDALIWVVHRKFHLNDLLQSEWCHVIRAFYLFVLTGSGLNLSLESWDCAAEATDTATLKLCFAGLPWWTYASLLFGIFLGVRLPIHILRISLFIVGEAVMAAVGPLKQPNEERFVRPLYSFILCAIYLAIYNWREREDRRRFLTWKSLSLIRNRLSQDKAVTASLLASICDEPQMEALIQGRSIHNKAKLAAVLVLDIHNFAEWRQQTEPIRALRQVDLHYRRLEDLRQLHQLDKVSLRGDRYIASLGLRSAQEQQEHSLRSVDTSPMLLFAVEASHGLRMRSILLGGEDAPMSARFGFGLGPCEGMLIFGASNVHYVLFGPAFDAALAHVEVATPNTIQVPRTLLQLAENLHTEAQDEADFCDFVRVLHVERSSEHSGRDSTLPLLHVVQGEEERSDSWLMKESSTEWIAAQAAAPQLSPKPVIETDTNPEVDSKIGIGSLWIRDEYAVRYLELQARSRTHVFSAVLLGFILSEVVVATLREAITLLTGLLYLLAVLLTGINLLPVPSTRMAAFGTGLATTILLLVAAVVGSPQSTVDRSAERLVLLALQFTVTSVDGIAPGIGIIFSCSLAAGLAAASVMLSFSLRNLVWNCVGLIVAVVVSVSQALTVTEAYKDLSLQRRLLTRLSAETDRMEHALRMVLPPYIIPIVVEKQRGNRADAIADIISDAALLIMRFPPQPSMKTLETLCLQIDALVSTQQHAFLLHMSGDLAFVGGPVQRPPMPSSAPQPLSSTVAGRALGRKLLNERTADVAARSLVLILSRLSMSTAGLTAVLNRGDAAAVVFGLKRPTFSIEGKLTEETLLVLNACPIGAACMTSQFFRRYPEPSELESYFACMAETRWSIRSAGSVAVRMVKPKPLPSLG